MKNNLQFFLLCALLIISVLVNITTCQRNKLVDGGDLFSGIVKAARQKDSSYLATIETLKLTNNQLYSLGKTSDSLLNHVISSIKQYNSNHSTVFQTKYFYTDSVRSEIVGRDTIKTDSTTYIYPTYHKQFANKWINYFYEVGNNRDTFAVSFNDEITYTQYDKREKWWKKKKTYVDIKTQNPYSTITDAKTIIIENKPIPLSLGLSIGYGMTTDLKPAGYIGFSLNYKLISLDFLWRKKKTNRDSKQ